MKKILSFVLLAFVLGLFVPQMKAGQMAKSTRLEAKAETNGKAKAKAKKKKRRHQKQAKHAHRSGKAVRTSWSA